LFRRLPAPRAVPEGGFVRLCDGLSGLLEWPRQRRGENVDAGQAAFRRAEPAGAETIREEIARRRISRQTLAEQAKLSLSTLEKVLGGRRPFTLATTVRLEQALGVSLRKGAGDRRACNPHERRRRA